ncbi:MAG: hypothetical protein K1Y36_10480 [Blastocatellia bacterium]|nr:hypothetical protein [Blastocatellia bacterium]
MEYLLFLCGGCLWLLLIVLILQASRQPKSPDAFVTFPTPAPESTRELCRKVIEKHRVKRDGTPKNQ